jgi:hypothetical protein
MIEYYQSLARQRRLTDHEQRVLNSAQEDATEVATGQLSSLDRLLMANLERLRVYALTKGDMLDDGLALLAAQKRGESDFLQCKTAPFADDYRNVLSELVSPMGFEPMTY